MRRADGQRWSGLAGAGALAVVVLLTAPWHLTNWILTHWTFLYGDGLRRRALVGSVVGWWAEEPVSQRTILLASGTLVVLFAAACVWLITRAWARQPTLLTAVAGICLLAAPGGLPLIAWDLGRFDVIGLLLMMVALAVVPRWKPAASLMLVAVVGGVGVAVHEAVLVAQLPLMLTAWWATTRPAPREGAMLVAVAVVPAVAVMTWIAAAGTLSPSETGMALDRVSGYIDGGFEPEPLSMAVQARDTGEGIAYTWSQVAGAESLLHRGVALAACAPALLVGWHLVRRFGRPGRLLAAASLGPISLFVVGHDWGRWLALITLNLLIAGLWLCSHGEERPVTTAGVGTGAALVAAAVVSVVLPPVSQTAGLQADWYWDLFAWL
jgi:hypothetical protein